jgi:GNAT superfamily N-acetyltransferase
VKQTETIQIIEAEPRHIPVIHQMIDELAEHLQLGHEVVATEGNLHNALFGPQPQAEVILAYLNDTPVGFALFYNNYSTFRGRCGLHLEDLYVRAKWRGHGIGKRLLSHLAGLTLARGCNRLEWWVLGEDEKAIAFYEALGASAREEWMIYRLRGEALANLAAEDAG